MSQNDDMKSKFRLGSGLFGAVIIAATALATIPLGHLTFLRPVCNICLAASNLEFISFGDVRIFSKEDLDNLLLARFPVGTTREDVAERISLDSHVLISRPFYQNRETLKYTFGSDSNESYQILYYFPVSESDRTGLGIRITFDQSDRLLGIYSEYYDSKSIVFPQFLVNQD